ncbi:PAS domain-containing protein [Methanofollis fontis]|uniref:Histidine kinase n=1 Tax=Methanofollis fontis TaxID=2052832 RepID=A0A483CQL1_9EURY|nr:PAS domain-containing protein [Methanofollis fontis]TAJ44975.1 histidine kinase [Methanofollis fontis]
MPEDDDTPTRILRALRFRPKGMTITEVAKRIGVTRNSVSKHLEIMQIAGKVDVRNVGNAKLYSLAQRVPMSAFLCFTKNLILILDSAGRIVQVNDRCQQALRRSKDDLLGLTLEEAALPVVSTPEAIAVVEGLEREQVITDLRYRSNGTDLFYQMQAIPTTFDDGEKGCTLVLEDITEQKRYVRNMEFLARTAMELVDLPAEADIYWYIADRIRELVPEARVIVHSFDEVNRQMILRAMEDSRFREDAKRIVGRDLPGTVFPITDLLSSAPFNYTPERFVPLREFILNQEPGEDGVSFYDLCAGIFPRDVCDIVVRELNLGKMYGIGLVWQDQVFGIASIFFTPQEELNDRKAFESFIRQASIAIARRQTEERLRRSEHRFREVIDSSPSAAALIDADGRYTFLNRRFTDLFGYTLSDIPAGREWFKKAFPDDHARKEAIAAWKSDLAEVGRGEMRPRTFAVRCKSGGEKAFLFRPVELCDGTHYVTYEDVTEERRAYQMLVDEIAELRRQLASPPE